MIQAYPRTLAAFPQITEMTRLERTSFVGQQLPLVLASMRREASQ